MSQYSAPLVGSYFRQGGKAILESLPAGCPLSLQRNPENEYDPYAIKVLLDPNEIPESQRDTLREVLGGHGVDLDDLLASEDLYHLGFVDSKKTGSARAWTEILVERQSPDETSLPFIPATLGFDTVGKPLVLTDLV